MEFSRRAGCVVAGLLVLGLVALFAATGLDTADKIASAVCAVLAVVALCWQYLVSPPGSSAPPVNAAGPGAVVVGGDNNAEVSTRFAGTDAERQALFEAACRRFAEIYRLPASTEFAVPGGPADRAYGSVLTLHMAALAVVDANAQNQLAPRGARDLSRYLLNRECHYWTVLHGEHRSTTAARAVFIACITGGLPQPAGAALLARSGLPGAAGTSAQQTLDAHARCYPPTTAGTVPEPLYPDRLAEDFIGLTLRTDQPDSLADTWCGSSLTDVFAREAGRVPGHAGRGLIFLAAAAATWPHVGTALRTLLHADPSLLLNSRRAS